ncbi:thioredoxin-like domain-containing protein [Chryseobacterium sp.]|uniref:thioredoxin-like domain-containing protein n=1 Tax=Chryseobacterium sp. TaxID=1871047 RepID=UPI0038910D53
MKQFKLLSILIILICFQGLVGQKKFIISGILTGFNENSVVKISQNNVVLDSCVIKNSKFKLTGSLKDTPINVYLSIQDKKDYIYGALFIGNEKMTLNADKKDFPFDLLLKGSKYNSLNYENNQKDKILLHERKKLEQEVHSLRADNKWNDSLQQAYWGNNEPLGKIKIVDRELDKSRDAFIDAHYNTYYGLYLLEMYKTVIPKDKLQNYYNKLSPNLKKTDVAIAIKYHLIYPELKLGEKYHNFSAFDKLDQKKQFSDYFKGKYILLDFSTLYCGFCLEALPQLENSKKSLNEKLEIITFYVDKNKVGFDGLLKKHSKDWVMLWDKKGRLSETYAKYKIYGTPTFFLFDPSGNLIKIFDGYSEDMSEKLNDILK